MECDRVLSGTVLESFPFVVLLSGLVVEAFLVVLLSGLFVEAFLVLIFSVGQLLQMFFAVRWALLWPLRWFRDGSDAGTCVHLFR